MNDWWQNKYNKSTDFLKTFQKWENIRNKLNIYKIINKKLKCKDILNVGCGTGLDYLKYKEYFLTNNINWFGLDYSNFMVLEGRKKNIPIGQGNIYELDFVINKKYECVLAINIFEHLDNFDLAFNNMLKVSSKYILISFFKIPLEDNKVIIINKHINNKDVKIKESISGKKFIKENPGFRNGFTKKCFYNIHNKNYIENIIKKKNLKFYWLKYDENELDTILLVVEI